jgi:solute carrier family 25 protein 38
MADSTLARACLPRQRLTVRRLDTAPTPELLPSAALRNFSASVTASVLATVLTQPVDVIRTRLQLGAVQGASAWQTGTILVRGLRDLARQEGASALLTGLVSRVAKRSLSTAITWTIFEEAMRLGSGGAG